MTENAVGIPGTSDLLRTELQATSAGQVNAEVIVVADATNVNAILKITDADPAPSDFGAVVRDPVMITVAASLAVMEDWDENDRAKVNLIVGQAGVDGGAGATTAATQRVVLVTDQAAIPVSGGLTQAQLEAELDEKFGDVGLKASAGSAPVVTASDDANLAALKVVGAGTAAAAQRGTLASDDPLVVATGAQADAAATTDAGTFSLLAFIKRGLQNWTTLQAKIPALVAGRVPVDATITPSGTQDENLKQVNGQTVNVGTGAAGTGTQRVAVASDSSITANAGTNLNTSALALEAGNLATIAGKDFATQVTLALIKAKTDNLDVALSTRTKPADTQPVSNTHLSNNTGTWGYAAGTSGTRTLSGSKRVLQITAIAQQAAASFAINGGDTITLPYGSTDKVSSAITIEPKGNLTDPTIVFTGTVGYFIEFVS